MLLDRGVSIEAKPFSIGFRIEHPQCADRPRPLRPDTPGIRCSARPTTSSSHHARNGRSVYSFCMCPGGTVVAATTEPGRVVTNGMSQYSRNERNANAGIVVGISRRRISGFAGRLGRARSPALRSNATGKRAPSSSAAATYDAPGQLVGDFLRRTPLERVRQRCCPRTSRASPAPISPTLHRLPAGVRDRRAPRGAARVRPPDPRLRDARRRADRRRNPHLLAGAHHARRGRARASTRAASTRPAKAPATPAASSPPASTASYSRSGRARAGQAVRAGYTF